ncbi:hypothetical protein BN7_1724 [Wickerhamomyces ciferrii]|uniref:Uncharacterized protein n=1 Tax=Wickerhamomyces ciferrii (strain ATCC 14091 / BCRC 22168 / CBS 111 / JCM 3599 / NBRC 0793 / NRRL Y-1031 F-60-10) TaxID=1206466 RepID=K0KB05_WICCF|nr:uncharacterized protein BN7_1724 [Wickerhamomyces ciferrii]CCH42180.1 hypothetical protein BN7_1724 [Wickerhamomyces ciferrii]
MEYSMISSAEAETNLSFVSFKLKKVDNSKEEILQKDKFPVVIRPVTNNIIKGSHQFVNFTEQSSTVPASLVYSRQPEIARPRNKFIIARSVLSKPVKNIYKDNTDDVSRIISMVS